MVEWLAHRAEAQLDAIVAAILVPVALRLARHAFGAKSEKKTVAVQLS
jgi:hypothetical protein